MQCPHRLAKDRGQARQFGPFLANRWVSIDEMNVKAGQQTGQRVHGRHVLAIQDTTSSPSGDPAVASCQDNGRTPVLQPVSGVIRQTSRGPVAFTNPAVKEGAA